MVNFSKCSDYKDFANKKHKDKEKVKHKDGSTDKFKDKHKEKRKEEKVNNLYLKRCFCVCIIFSFTFYSDKASVLCLFLSKIQKMAYYFLQM